MPIGTLWASRPPWDTKRTFLICMLFSIVMLTITACGQNSTPQTSANPLSDPRTLATSASADGRFSVDAPPSMRGETSKLSGPFADVKPLEIRQGGSLGALGLNLDTYFAGNVGDTNERLNRLEGSVTAIHRDLKILAPAMQRLALIENDLQDLVGQLEAMLQEEGGTLPEPAAYTPPAYTPPPPSIPAQAPQSLDASESAMIDQIASKQPAPVAAPTTPAPVVTATPTPVAGSPRIVALRFGGDAGKTRIVFDADQAVTYTQDIDNNENLLVVELPKATWGAAAQGTAPKSSVIDTWSSQPGSNGGTRIVMTLKKPASIVYEGVMKPESSNPHHRVVLDLKPN